MFPPVRMFMRFNEHQLIAMRTDAASSGVHVSRLAAARAGQRQRQIVRFTLRAI